PPADFLLADPEERQHHDQLSSPDGEIRQEREIVRILLNYGRDLVTWEGDGSVPIAPYLLQNINDVDFVDKPSLTIVEEFKRQAKEFEVPDAKFLLCDEDKEVAGLAVDCMATQYESSPNWNDDKRKIYVSEESEQLKELVLQAICRIKKRKCAVEMKKNQEEIKKPQSPEDMEILLFNYKKLKEAENTLGQLLGNIVIR